MAALAPSRRDLLLYALLGLALWPVPLLNVLHAESAAVVALASYFIAGTAALRSLSAGARAGVVTARHLLALLVPLAMLTVSRLWAPNCAYATGLLFFALFPGITVPFAVAVAAALTHLVNGRRRQTALLILAGGAIAIAGPIYDLGLHPQFYTYNHVFGGVLGPIYDEQLALRPGLFVFRGLTLAWTGVLFGAAAWGRGRLQSGAARAAVGACVVAIAGVYAYPSTAGINTTEAHLQDRLGGHVRTPHFDLYYDPASMPEREVEALAADHEAELQRLAERLDVDPSVLGRVQSYLYPSPERKAHLTGARTTSVSPVWLASPQVHLLRSRVDDSFSHELAHVFSRPYGLPLLRASWAVGLVEGWAVALEAPDSRPAPHDLVLAASADDDAGLQARAEGIARRLSPWGFWTGRGAVSYATMGSFVGYLLDTYGPEPLTDVYARADFRRVYGRSLDRLADDWARALRQRSSVPAAAREIVSREFTRPSLFETTCPHYVPPYRRDWQDARRARAEGDTTRARRLLAASIRQEPRFAAAQVDRARLLLAQRRPGAAADSLAAFVQRASRHRPGTASPAALVTLGDARALQGRPAAAAELYRRAVRRLPRHRHDDRTRIRLREALAARPDAVSVLASGRPAADQARRLLRLPPNGNPAVRAYAAVRWQDAHAYDRALAVWEGAGDEAPNGRDEDEPGPNVPEAGAEEGEAVRAPDRPGRGAPLWAGLADAPTPGPHRPAAWRRGVEVQAKAWHATAALRAAAPERAARLAEEAAAAYRHYGARPAAEALDALAERARRAVRSTQGREAAAALNREPLRGTAAPGPPPEPADPVARSSGS